MKRIVPTLPVLLALLAPAACGENLTQPPDRDPSKDPDPQPLSCLPNLDGRIDAVELRPAIGTQVGYVISPSGESRTVDVAGKKAEGGTFDWDFSTDYADDESLKLTPASLSGKWYAASFPEGAFVTPFNREGTLESIGLARDDAFLLLGLASAEESPAEGQTLLVYDTPITVLQFPVVVGQSFVSSGEITSGVAFGLPYAGRDTYEVDVDAEGAIDLLQYSFDQVLRVRTTVTVEPAVGAAVTRKQVSFYAECFAEVARATSQDGETNDDFTEAAELRRLGF